jgi:2-succinyl-6-hydroxy-2,4-cyclohexadiene-1-carboxylate synthase
VPEVVFLPGFMQHADSWSPIAAAVGERYPVKLLDFQTWTFEERLGEIRSGGEGSVLAGYSMGGRLALHAAVRWPDEFAAVATVGASAGIEDAEARQARREADEDLASWIESHAIDDVVDRWERNPVFASQPPELVEAQRPGRLKHDPLNLAKLLRTAGQGAQDPIWQKVEALDLPRLAIAGENDKPYAEAATRLAGGAAVLVPGAGHAAHLEQPDLVAAALLRWLTALGPALR